MAALVFLLLAAAGCRRGPPDEEVVQAVYRDYREAIKSGDAERVKVFLNAEKRKELSDPDVAVKLDLIRSFMPPEVRIVKATVSGPEAKLEVESDQQGHRMTGTVRLVKEGNDWKIDKEDWSMKIDLTSQVMLGEIGPFFPEPRSPPQAHAVLEGHQGEVTQLAFTPDGGYLVSASYGDYSIRAWRLDTLEQVSEAKTESRVRGLDVSPDGKTVFTTDVRKSVLAWPLEAGTIGSPRLLLSDAGDALALSGDGVLLATAGFQSPVRIWKVADGTVLEELAGPPNQRAVALGRDGKRLVSGGDGNTYSHWMLKPRLWGLGGESWVEDRRTIAKVSAEGGIAALDLSPDGKLLATGHNDSSIVIFDVPGGRELFNFYVTDAATRDVEWSPDGAILATAQQDKAVYLWDARTARQLAALKGHREPPVSLAFSPDGKTMASGGEDRRIILWRGGPPPSPPAALDAAPGGERTLEAGAFAPAPGKYRGQPNYLQDPFAYHCASAWQRKGEAVCEAAPDGNPHFAVRYGGMFWQDVPIPESTGRYALLVARASSERVHPDDDQTGFPYLYGYMVDRRDDHRFHAHLNGQQMTLRPRTADEWGTIWGVFPVPAGTGAVKIYLQQADGGQAQNGSAARFDDVGVFLFDTEAEARGFAEDYAR
jgi:sugar lactone lactonase YvrE